MRELDVKSAKESLVADIEHNMHRVLNHPLYHVAKDKDLDQTSLLEFIQCFMEHHVWAVWDYFQILKRLQGELTCTKVPWRPIGDRQLRRFINEIVLEEETDMFEDGETPGSHLELYLRGMDQAGANTIPMRSFLEYLGTSDMPTVEDIVAKAKECGAPPAAVKHIRGTLDLAMNGKACEVAGVLAFGREDIIPKMFIQLLPNVHAQTSIFRYYLERHIELDGEDHGPLAIRLVEIMCNDESSHHDVSSTTTDAKPSECIDLTDLATAPSSPGAQRKESSTDEPSIIVMRDAGLVQNMSKWDYATKAINSALENRYDLWQAVHMAAFE